MEKEPSFEGADEYELTPPDIKLTDEQEKRVRILLATNPKMEKGEAIKIVLGVTKEQKNE